MRNEIDEMKIYNRRLTVVFSNNYRELTLTSVFKCLAHSSPIANLDVPFKLEVYARDADHISLFFATATELDSTLYFKAVESLAELSRNVPLKVSALVSGHSTTHGDTI